MPASRWRYTKEKHVWGYSSHTEPPTVKNLYLGLSRLRNFHRGENRGRNIAVCDIIAQFFKMPFKRDNAHLNSKHTRNRSFVSELFGHNGAEGLCGTSCHGEWFDSYDEEGTIRSLAWTESLDAKQPQRLGGLFLCWKHTRHTM